jgi:dihydrofolate reductase
MLISIIVAMDEQRGIGKEGYLPWHLSADLKRFKHLTMGHHLIMGRKTYESIGRPLPGRTMIVITRNRRYAAEGCLIAASLKAALAIAEQRGETEAFIAGGGQVFSQALAIADRIYLTQVHAVTEADVFFPEFDAAAWDVFESSHYPADEKNHFPSTFSLLTRMAH